MTATGNSPLTRIGRWFEPWAMPVWEGAALRILFAWVVLISLPLAGPASGLFRTGGFLGPAGRLSYDSQPLATGLAQWFDLTFFSDPALQLPLWIVCGLCLISMVAGRGLFVSLPILAAVLVLGRTFENSQGFINHRYQIVGSILVAQAIVAVVFSIRRAGRERVEANLFRYAQIIVIGAYVIAGLSKLIESDGEWVRNSPNFGLDLVKSNRQQYYNALAPAELGPPNLPPGAVGMMERPGLTRAAMGAGLALELFCFVALFDWRLAAGIGLMLIAFHFLNERYAGLSFGAHEQVVWIFLINPAYWIGMAALTVWNRLREPSDSGE